MKMICKILSGSGMICFFGSIALADTAVKLQKSVVSAASGTEKSVIDAPASVSVVGKEELERKPYRDLGEALKEVPGVSLDESSNKLGASSISIRGMPSGYTLFLIDGLRQNPSGEIASNLGVGVYNTFIPPLSAIERIEVIKGPMSTLYGSDAIGGVVNVITKPITSSWATSFQSQVMIPEASTFGNTYQNSLYVTGPIVSNLGLSLRVRQINREKSERPRNDRGELLSSFFGAKYALYNVGTRLTYMPNGDNELYVDVDYTTSKYDNRDGSIGTLGANNKSGKGGYEEWIGLNKLLTSAVHKGKYSFGNWKNSLQFMQSENTGRKVVGKTDAPDFGKNREITSNDFIADSRLLLPLGDYNNLNVGAEYRYENYHDLAATPASHSRNTFALFVEDEWNMIDPLTLTLGTRYNYNDKFGSNLSPRAYIVYEVFNDWSLKGGVATGYKAPYANQLIDAVYGYGSQGALAFLGNPDLKSESSVSYEVGPVYDGQYVDFSFTLFQTNFKDKIELQRVGKVPGRPDYSATCAAYGNNAATNCNRAYNADTALSRGLEASFGIKPIQGVGFDVSYTYVDSKITSGKSDGQPLADVAKHSVVSKVSYGYGNFDMYLQGQYKAGLLNTVALGNSPEALATKRVLGSEYYKPYTVLNLGLGYEITKFLRINGGVYNILDTNFVDFRYAAYGDGRYLNINMYGPMIQEGRRYWANVALNF